jgi:two-component sensor histidine kinase
VEGGPTELTIEWSEAGGPPVQPPTRRGFGTRLIERGLSAELRSEVKMDFRPTGLNCAIHAKLPSSAE